MNIVFVSTFDQRCGIATYTRKLGDAITAHGHQVFVYGERQVLAHENDEVKQLGACRYLRRWSRGLPYDAPFGLGTVAKSILSAPRKPDVVHIQHEFGFFPRPEDLSRFTSELHDAGIPSVMTLHTVSPEHELLLQRMSLAADCIVHTPEAFALMARCGGWSAIIPHGVTELRGERAATAQRYYLVPGYISRSKNILEIIEGYWRALKLTDSPHRQALPRLIIAGLCRDAEYEAKIHSALNRYLLGERVWFRPDYVADDAMEKYLLGATAVVLGGGETSPYSASGQLHDAVGAGVPVIAKNVPIYRHPAGAGLLHYGDAEELAQWLVAVDREDVHVRMRYLSHPLATSLSWENVARMTLRQYLERHS